MSRDQTTSPPIRRGATITLLASGQERTLDVERVSEGLVWVSTRELGALQPGERVEIELGVRGDARYCTPARVAIAMRDFVGLRLESDWDRKQAREFVRVSTYGHRVDVASADDDTPAECKELPLIDLSAGGARFAEEKDLGVGDRVSCRLALGGPEFELRARVVWISSASATRRRFVSIEFEDVDERVRADLIGWVNQEQLRRRTQIRDRSSGSHGAPKRGKR